MHIASGCFPAVAQQFDRVVGCEDTLRLLTNHSEDVFRQISLERILVMLLGIVLSSFDRGENHIVASTEVRLKVDPSTVYRSDSAATAIDVAPAEPNGFILELPCESGSFEALLKKKGTQIRVFDVAGGVAKSVLAVAAGLYKLFDQIYHVVSIHAFAVWFSH